MLVGVLWIIDPSVFGNICDVNSSFFYLQFPSWTPSKWVRNVTLLEEQSFYAVNQPIFVSIFFGDFWKSKNEQNIKQCES